MKTKTSGFSKFFDNESRLFSAYRKAHPHFWMCLGSEALLVVLLTVAGYTISQHISPDIDKVFLGRTGGVAMTAHGLVEHVQDRKLTVFWSGPNQSIKYTIICNRPQAIVLNLFGKNSSQPLSKQADTVIETFSTIQVAKTEHALSSESAMQTVNTPNGQTAQYDPSSMKEIDISYSSRPEVVHIHYSKVQKLSTMLRDANSLQLVM